MSEEKICKTCGKSINQDFNVCPYCGNKDMEYSERNGLICLGLCVIFGYFCAHNFYAGKMKLAVVLLVLNILSTALFVIGGVNFILDSIMSDTILLKISASYFGIYFLLWLADLITLINGKFKDSKGKYIKIN